MITIDPDFRPSDKVKDTARIVFATAIVAIFMSIMQIRFTSLPIISTGLNKEDAEAVFDIIGVSRILTAVSFYLGMQLLVQGLTEYVDFWRGRELELYDDAVSGKLTPLRREIALPVEAQQAATSAQSALTKISFYNLILCYARVAINFMLPILTMVISVILEIKMLLASIFGS